MDLIRKLSEQNLWYIPIIVVCVLLLAGFLNGFFRGWKSSLYFMVWNLFGFYVALLILDAIYDSVLKDMAKNWFAAIEDSLGDKAFDDFFALFHGWLVLMMVLLVLSFWNFIAWIVHFFFKKRFQKHLKENKAAGKSNAGSRLIGGFFGIVAVIPSAASAMASSTVISSNDELNKNVDSFVKAMTFGKVDEVSGDWDAMYGLALSASSARDFTLIVTGNVDANFVTTMVENGFVKNAPSIVRMFNNEKSATIGEDVVKHQFETLKYEPDPNDPNADLSLKEIVLTKDQVDAIATQNPTIQGIFAGLNPSGKATFDKLFKAGDDFKTLLTTPVAKP